MKIPSNAPPHLAQGISPNKPSVNAPQSTERKKAQSAGTSTSALQQRITHWFAQIGVTPHVLDIRGFEPHEIANFRRLKEQNRLNNLKSIMSIALGVSYSESSTEQLDPDWFHAFADMAEHIFSPAMQELWGKILAVEVQRPGSFSLRTLETLTKLTQRDAELFSRACQLACKRNQDSTPIILSGFHNKPGLLSLLTPGTSGTFVLAQHGLSFTDILALSNMKLVYASEMETGLLAKGSTQTLKFSKSSVQLTPNKPSLWLTYYRFTSVGAELSRLIPRNESESFVNEIQQVFGRYFSVTR
ncbi:TIGR03899 family protein [Aestuariibacter sp. GS-14]|uniref:TIGR03899 family protein n=1 Tax=Aestuariibacter sp. GS-14 TaxID=2590670 RepID=UPI00112E90DC|nr:TIGR03899 family protein [Aestuariibacter sp. GS-14]TPV56416.1 TIGR03899 family protein [Aestuariibacter sp. GS-14]